MKEQFSETTIKEELNRILSTPSFKGSRVLSGFLKFVINETLAGRAAELKEYTIGVSALSRNSDFNPQLDAMVRIHAGRLRRALKEYYHENGKEDPIYIDIPKGTYIPQFHSQDNSGSTRSSKYTEPIKKKPVVSVFPFRNVSKDGSNDYFAEGLGEQLSTELTWFHDLSVISYYSSRHVAANTNDVKEAARILGAHYILTGSIQIDDRHLRVWVQLITCENGQQLWTKSFDQNSTARGLFEIQNEIVKGILTAIGGYYGVIFRDMLKGPQAGEETGLGVYDAIYLYYHYQKVFTKEAVRNTIIALEAAVKTDPNYALAWAMLGELYLDENAIAIKKIENPIELGLTCAKRAISLDPTCQHAYQALSWIYLFLHDKDACVKAVDQCLALNPNASDVVGTMGFALSCAGEFDRAIELLNDSIEHNPHYPWWFNMGFVCYFLQCKEYQEAFHHAEKINMPHLFWDPLFKASALGHLGRFDEATKNLDLLQQLMPDAGIQVKDIIGSFLLSKKLNEELLEGLRKAGLKMENRISVLRQAK